MKIRNTASSLSQFVEWTEQVTEAFTDGGQYETPWFRGMASAKYNLLPGLYRSVRGQEEYADDEMRSEFRRRGLPLVAERPPRDDWEWYSLMQHYGAPTRLLDWTDSALMALYFAISSTRMNPEALTAMSPVVWALNPWKLNKNLDFEGPITPEKFEKFTDYMPELFSGKRPPQYPIALDPTFIAQRMLVQHSHFTLHGSDVRGLDDMIHDLKLEDSLFQIVIRFDFEEIPYMRQRLAVLGITETTIFPDLNGLARELCLEYEIYW
jgi:hypothetical protein